MTEHKVPVQSLIDHIKTAQDVDPWAKEMVEELLKKQPEIVRCKDCKHATMTSDGKMCKYCAMDTDDFGDQRDVYHDANWFCADGIPKSKQLAYADKDTAYYADAPVMMPVT